jgi:AcrR family transcriptional regulator
MADALFRRLGFAKTAVADNAAEPGMSPANVYRFFPSKNAIVQAICHRCLGEAEDRLWAVVRSRESASVRLEKMMLENLAYHKENLIEAERVNDIVMVAMEQSWDAIMAHKEAQRGMLELIIRDGIEAGEFTKVDPRETSKVIQQSFAAFCHPVLIAQGLQEKHDLEAEARAMARFALLALTPRK